MVFELLPSYCAAPLVPSLGCIPREARSQNPVVGLHRPRGWLERARPLSAETGSSASSAAAPSPGTAFPSDTSEARVSSSSRSRSSSSSSRRRRRQMYLETRLHATADSASSASSPPPSSSSTTQPPPPPPQASATKISSTTTGPPEPSRSLDPGAFSGEGGAEWAGWECRFSATDGKPVPVPEDYVPESLREWDVEVWGFETLTSEQLRPGGREEVNGKGDNGGGSALYRKRGRVYPETGCALDNLNLEVNALTSPLEGDGTFVASFPGGDHVVGKKAEGSTSLQLEVGIMVPGVQFIDPSMAMMEGEAAEAEHEMSRLRVEVRVDSSSDGGGGSDKEEAAAVLGPTVTVTRERRYRDTFDDGLLYKGGGLDSQKLRRLLRSKCFAESEAAPTSDDLTGRWTARDGNWQMLDGPTAEDQQSDATAMSGVGNDLNRESVQTMLLPGGVTVRSGTWPPDDGASRTVSFGEARWAVEVGWFLGAEKADVHKNARVVLTTVLDATTMTPLAAWKGEERRE